MILAGLNLMLKKQRALNFSIVLTLGREENCNVAVVSCFVSNTKHFPGDFRSYLPLESTEPKNFKSKLDLAKELHRRCYFKKYTLILRCP